MKDDPKAREWCNAIMEMYQFRDDVRRVVMQHCIFSVRHWDEVYGGGWFHFSKPRWVELFTRQHEAAIHELAHASWWAIELLKSQGVKDALVERLCAEFERQAELPANGYPRVRGLCRDYKHGLTFAGMWMPDKQRWNHDEIFAGIVSGVMGDAGLIPPPMRSVFGHVLRLPQMVRLPMVMG